MPKKYKLKKISKGHYEYRGCKIDCVGYYHPEKRVCWECTYTDGTTFGHSYTMRDCLAEIDSEIEKTKLCGY